MECYKYRTEDQKKKYRIFLKIRHKKLNMFIFNKTEKYMSNYLLEDLNAKLSKLIQFKTIEDFKAHLIKNIKEKQLILKSPYKNVINSVWKIFPLSKEKRQTFTLISSLDTNKSISLFFYSDYASSEKVVKEIDNSIIIKKLITKNEEKTYTNYFYDHWLIENMFFLNKNVQKINKKDEFLSMYKQITGDDEEEEKEEENEEENDEENDEENEDQKKEKEKEKKNDKKEKKKIKKKKTIKKMKIKKDYLFFLMKQI